MAKFLVISEYQDPPSRPSWRRYLDGFQVSSESL